MHNNGVFRIGKIDSIGDPNKSDEVGRFKVHIIEEDIVTGWLYQLKRSTLKNQDDWVFDIGETVACTLYSDMREGVIHGAINTVKAPNKTTDKDTEQMTFSDGSIIKYDRNAHEYDLTVKNGTINITSDNDINVKSNNGKVIINGGNNDGIPIEQKIEDNFNNLKTYIDNIATAVSTGLTAVGTSSAASGPAGATAFQGAIASNTFTVEDMKDENAKH